ncbi:hypothetical protein DINM_005957 [Dirofilaria immitis]|nr:hypothetical protein [Dirofilaria immitis]
MEIVEVEEVQKELLSLQTKLLCCDTTFNIHRIESISKSLYDICIEEFPNLIGNGEESVKSNEILGQSMSARKLQSLVNSDESEERWRRRRLLHLHLLSLLLQKFQQTEGAPKRSTQAPTR